MDTMSYESNDLLQQYLLFHYGEEADQLPWDFGPTCALNFPARCVSEGVDIDRLPGRERALDVGCAVGRASFEMARIFDETIGIDFSDSFVMAARLLSREKVLPFHLKETGGIYTEKVLKCPEVSGRLQFEQGDAHDLRESLGTFDCVLAANLLCRLHHPTRFLERLPDLVRRNGQLILTTPNTWLESFTARDYWLGATPETGEPLEAIQAQLAPAFELDATWDMPFLIREHRRKYQWSVAQASRWVRK